MSSLSTKKEEIFENSNRSKLSFMLKVLIADNSSTALKNLKEKLKYHCSVETADNGFEALNMVK